MSKTKCLHIAAGVVLERILHILECGVLPNAEPSFADRSRPPVPRATTAAIEAEGLIRPDLSPVAKLPTVRANDQRILPHRFYSQDFLLPDAQLSLTKCGRLPEPG